MTSLVVPKPVLAASAPDGITRYPDGAVDLEVSPELKCHYDPEDAILWTTSTPQGIPCFSSDLLHAMERGSQLVEGYFSGAENTRPLRYIVVRSGVPKVFSTGGDLGYFLRLIAAQDRARLTEYARAAINVAYRNYTAHNLQGVTTVALLEGDALGGGFESALSCDILIAEEHIKAGFPEVLFNMFPGMGGLSFLARRAGRKVVDELTRSGRQYGARELLEMGVIDQVVPTGQAVEAVSRLMRQREHQFEAHSAMNGIDRLLRPINLNELNEVVRMWVDCAMHLSPRGQAWMKRLHQQQLANFGSPLSLVPGSTHAMAQSG
jgi:DSF synthase